MSFSQTFPEFDPAIIQAMRAVLDRCRYVKDLDLLMHPANNPPLRIEYQVDSIILKNFRFPIPQGERAYLGVCDDLPVYFHQLLKREIGPLADTLGSSIVQASHKEFREDHWIHYSCLYWPMSRDSEVRKSLKKSRELYQKDQVASPFPEGVLRIDPSCGLMGFPDPSGIGDKLWCPTSIEEIGYHEVMQIREIGACLFAGATSLGRLKYLDPNSKNAYPSACVLLAFLRGRLERNWQPILLLQRTPSDSHCAWPSWEQEISKECVLAQFVNHLRELVLA